MFDTTKPSHLSVHQDSRQVKSIVLPNKLQVLLISGPNFTKSAAALDVGVGSLANPTDAVGMAHFLEHMLFLGTKKYPDHDEYRRYLASYQGENNAYTADEQTNYYLEINHEGFEGALDRFSQFFIAPLFTPEFVDKELNAIESEHQKNLNSDLWRWHRVMLSLSKKGHPRSLFSTGNKETLKGTKNEELLAFYKKYYSANQMKLVLTSNSPIDQLEKWAKEYFGAVPNHDREDLTYDSQLFDPKDLPRKVFLKPVKDVHEVLLAFPMPTDQPYWRSKPTRFLSFMFGHEGEGSLLSDLKSKHYTSSLSSWFESTSFSGEFYIRMELTKEGLKNVDEIVEMVFAYAELLKKTGLPKYVFEEEQTMAAINYVYKEHEEGGGVAASLASKMFEFEPTEIERHARLYYDYKPEDFSHFLSFVRPSNVNVLIMDRGVKTDQTETFYGAEFSTQKISPTVLASWEKPKVSPQLTMPVKNNLVPDNLESLEVGVETPFKVVSEPGQLLWLAQETKLQQPKAKVTLLLYTEEVSRSAKARVLTTLYERALMEGLNEWLYQVHLAGLSFDIFHNEKGMYLGFSGYAQRIPNLISDVTSKLKTIDISQDTLANIKDEYKRKISNIEHAKAYQRLMYEMSNVTDKKTIHYTEIYDPSQGVDLISDVSLEDIRSFASRVYRKINLQGLASGHMSQDDAKGIPGAIFKDLGSEVLTDVSHLQEEVVALPNKAPLYYSFSMKNPNYSWGAYQQFGPREVGSDAALRIGDAFLASDFFNTLRTQEQLGYVVHMASRNTEHSLGLFYLIQSSHADPNVMDEKVQKWRKEVLERLSNLSEFEFETLRHGVVTELEQPDKTIFEKHSTLLFEALTLDGQFHYKKKVAQAAGEVTKEDLYQLFKKAYEQSDIPSLTLFLFKDKIDAKLPKGAVALENISAFKAEAKSLSIK